MAVEVAAGKFLFGPSLDNADSKMAKFLDRPTQEKTTKFKFFTLHDVESVWWLSTFVLFNNRVKDAVRDQPREELQIKAAKEFFPPALSGTDRQNCFKEGHFLKKKSSIDPTLHKVVHVVELMRSQLVSGYKHAEKIEELNLDHVPYTLSYFSSALSRLMDLSQGITLEPGLKFDSKRPAQSVAEETSRKKQKN
jgi:hypothetical protein